jgi:hypothetical protein
MMLDESNHISIVLLHFFFLLSIVLVHLDILHLVKNLLKRENVACVNEVMYVVKIKLSQNFI